MVERTLHLQRKSLEDKWGFSMDEKNAVDVVNQYGVAKSAGLHKMDSVVAVDGYAVSASAVSGQAQARVRNNSKLMLVLHVRRIEKQQKTSSAATSSKRKEVGSTAAAPPVKAPKAAEPRQAKLQYVYLVTLTQRNPYESSRRQTVGMYSTKELAISNARKAFETHSNGFFRDGKFTEPDIFEQTLDNSKKKMGESGVVYKEGESCVQAARHGGRRGECVSRTGGTRPALRDEVTRVPRHGSALSGRAIVVRKSSAWLSCPTASSPRHSYQGNGDSHSGLGCTVHSCKLTVYFGPQPGFVTRDDARGHGPRKGKWTLCSSRWRGSV